MNKERFKILLDRYMTDRLTPLEKAEFSAALETTEQLEAIKAELEASFMNDEFEGYEYPGRKERITGNLLQKIRHPQPSIEPANNIHFLQRPWFKLAVACIFIFAVLGILYLRTNHTQTNNEAIAETAKPSNEIAPGKNGAILTLDDGSRIVLDSMKNGKLATQGAADLVLHANHLTYQNTAASEVEVTYNTLEVPRGRQFQLVLQDGTRVWLNAESRLKYPTSFPGGDRTVEVSGEAYFEVAHDETKPFIVKKDNIEITVLGTHFNVHAYDDEKVPAITLLEGSVNVKNGGKNVTIHPGQQAKIGDDISVINNVDTDEVVAWKDGKFQFGETADIQSVMRQISRWYDVEIKYEGTIKNHLGGTLSRDVPLTQLLRVLQTTGVVKFEVEGRMIVVKP